MLPTSVSFIWQIWQPRAAALPAKPLRPQDTTDSGVATWQQGHRRREKGRREPNGGGINGGGRFIKCQVAATKSLATVDLLRLPVP